MGTVLFERSNGYEQPMPRASIHLNPLQFSEICHRVLNYRAPYAREERSAALSITPEQLEETPVVPEPHEEDVAPPPANEELVVEDFLVEDVSIDGMCGVY